MPATGDRHDPPPERAAEIRKAGAEAVVCDVFDAPALRRGRRGEAGRRGPRADRAAAADRSAPRGHLPGDQPAADRGHSKPDRGGAGGGSGPIRRPVDRLRLRAGRAAGRRRGGAGGRGAPPGISARRWTRSWTASARCWRSAASCCATATSTARDLVRARRDDGRGLPQAPFPDRRLGRGRMIVRARRGRGIGDGGGLRARSARGSTTSATTSRRRMREWIPVYAEAVGAKRPLRVPRWVAGARRQGRSPRW